MSSDPPAAPRNPLWHTAKEYLTHWFVAGVTLTLTGFTPDHWVANVFHAVKLDSLRSVFSEYQFLAVYIGVTFLIVDAVVRNRGRRFEPAAATPAAAPDISAPLPLTPEIEESMGKPSIAVLPFVNMSSDKEQEYFADGMTEDIITGLSCDSRLFVTARNSTFAYKGQSPDIRAVGKELGVRYVLEGSIRPVSGRLRINVQLIETASGNHVWADKIDRPAAEIFSIMDEVVDDLLITLCTNLGVAESNRAKRQRPENLQAWALCVQAEVLFFSTFSSKTQMEAERLARRATEIEPAYAAGWAMLALAGSYRVITELSSDLAKDSEETMSWVNKALELAPNDPVVLSYCGYACIPSGQAALGVDYLQRSLALNPNNGFSQFAHGSALVYCGRFAEGRDQLELFIRRAPNDPYIAFAYNQLSFCYLGLFDPLQAEQAARNAIKYGPGMFANYLTHALTLTILRRDAEAQALIQQMLRLEPGYTRQHQESYWRHAIREQDANAMIKLLRRTWPD